MSPDLVGLLWNPKIAERIAVEKSVGMAAITLRSQATLGTAGTGGPGDI
jgi:hypothetical protein